MKKSIDKQLILKLTCLSVLNFAIWAICLALFNLIVFITPEEIGDVCKYSGGFWAAYAFITVAFFIQLACTFFALFSITVKKAFYSIPLVSISYGGVIAMLIVGSIFLAIPQIPAWFAIILCAIVLACDVVAIVKSIMAATVVSEVDNKVETKTAFIKELTYEASVLNSSASEELKSETKRVYEAIRYSDPTSSEALDSVNADVKTKFDEFSNAIASGNSELAKSSADSFIKALEARNQKCKMLK